jgi:hypothetical protein
MDRIERIGSVSGRPRAVDEIQRNARTDPDGSRRDHPEGDRRPPRAPRPPDPNDDDGLSHVDVKA